MSVKFNSSGIHIKQYGSGYRIHHIVGTNEWCVEYYGQCVKICDTQRQAKEYISNCTGRRV